MTPVGSGGGRGIPATGGVVPAAVGLGSNRGDRAGHLAAGVLALDGLLQDLRCSRVYETEPVGAAGQARFLNMCCVGRSRPSPGALLRRLQEIEAAEGRSREAEGAPEPRTLDLDLLLYGEQRIEEPGLRVPHPRMRERAFVLVPLSEVAGGWRDPVTGRTVEEMARRVGDAGVEPYAGPIPGNLREAIETPRSQR